MADKHQMVSPNDLYEMVVKRIGKEPKTETEKRMALFIMSCPIHPVVRLSATRLLNRIYKFGVEDEYIKAICSYWDSHSWEDFVATINFMQARRN